MKNITRAELVKALDLDFSKYEYYYDYGAYRYDPKAKTTDLFVNSKLVWEESDIDIFVKYTSPFRGDDVEEYSEKDKDKYVDWIYDHVKGA